MTEPRAQQAARYLETLGVRVRPRSRAVVDDDDYDVEIGAAQVEPEPAPEQPTEDGIDVEIGAPRIESRETVVPQIDIVGDPRANEVGNIVAALPEWLSEPASRAMRDPNSRIGDIARAVGTAPLWRSVRDGSPTSIGTLLGNESLEEMQTFGERGADALPLGFGEEIYSELTGQAQLDRLGVRPSDPDRPTNVRGLGASSAETERDQYLRERAERTVRNPVASGAGTVAGSLPAAVLTPGPTSGSVLGRVGQAARNNALVGTITGAGLAEEGQRLEGGAIGGAAGGLLGGGAQLVGEGVGALANLLARRSGPGRAALEQVGPVAARVADVTDGPQQAGNVRRLLAMDDAVQAMPDGAQPGMFPDDELAQGVARTPASDAPRVPGRSWVDDLPDDPADRYPFDAGDTLEAQAREAMGSDEWARRARVGDDATPRPGRGGRRPAPTDADVIDVNDDDIVGAAAPRAELSADDVLDDVGEEADEFLGAVPERARRPEPTMPEQGPALRAAALRGERSFGARGEAGADPSIQFSDELSAMARDYADIEGGVGGFQPLKDRRITAAMAEAPPPPEWAPRAATAMQEMRARLDAITRHAGADSRMVRSVGEARFALDEAERMLNAANAFGGARPADVYRMLNRANMGVGRAAAAEARQSGMGMQHTTAFAEPLTQSYQNMRAFLMDEGTWGAAARVQREMNASTAPLLRTGRALRDRVGTLFQDSGETAAQGNGFRTYETVRPEAVRGVFGRAGDDAYESERQLLRAWIENYGDQGQALARLSDDPALAPQAQAMQERASRLLDILDRAQVEGRAAQLLQSVSGTNVGRVNVGTLVRTLARIEAGELTVPALPGATRMLEALEQRLGSFATSAGTATPALRELTNVAAAQELGREPRPARAPGADRYGDVPGVVYELDDTPDAGSARDPYADIPGVVYEDDEDPRRTQ